MKKFECTVCHYVAEGSAPEVCPVCKQSGKFAEINPLKGTKTEANLQAAFAGESQARNKYTYFASKAKKEGFVQIAAIFEETAKNEQEHAKIWFKLLNGGEISSTAENLWRLRKAKTTNGRICITNSRRLLAKKVLKISQSFLTALRLSKRNTKIDTESCLQT